jgi:hypothetical protein
MPAAAVLAVLLVLPAVAGCSAAGGGRGARAPVRCGMSHTAAGVPVVVEITAGSVTCRVALDVEHAYAQAVASGKVPGNGGGAPVTIHGWVCQGFNTPKVLATGHASACHKNGTEILAVLPTPSATSL